MKLEFDPTNPHMHTASGKTIYLLDPKPEDLDIEDIAHSLSRQVRFLGHTRQAFTVAQHCVYVWQRLVTRGVTDPITLRWGLLHDAAEAYLGDLISPVKAVCPEYRKLEEKFLQVIGQNWCRSRPIPPEVVRADRDAAHCEFTWLFDEKQHEIVSCWDEWDAQWRFMEAWRDVRTRTG